MTLQYFREGGLPIIADAHWLLFLLLPVFLLICSRLIYRLYFHPLSKFPGPKLAAITSLYAAYYNIVRGGSYIKQIPGFHEKYGPIVRILPNEIHVQSIDSYNQVFRVGTPFDRAGMKSTPLFSGSLITLTTLHESRKRRELYSTFFSRAAVRRAELLIQAKIDQFLDNLAAASSRNEIVNFTFAFRCLGADVVMQYAYQEDFGALKDGALTMPFIEMLTHSSDMAQWYQHFPWFFGMLNSLAFKMPERLKKRYLKPLVAMQMLHADARARIQELKGRPKYPPTGGGSSSYTPTIFDNMLSPKPGRKGDQVPLSDSAITAEAILMLEAGQGTTGHALCVATWNILSNPSVLARMRAEIARAKADGITALDLETVESDRFRYLRAVVKESLRFSYGAPGRLVRKVPAQGAVMDAMHIPGGVNITSSIYTHNHNPKIFPDPFLFDPDRWLRAASHPNPDPNCLPATTSPSPQLPDLERHMLSFSRGSRKCLGMNLAYAELHLVLAQLFERFDIDVHHHHHHHYRHYPHAPPARRTSGEHESRCVVDDGGTGGTGDGGGDGEESLTKPEDMEWSDYFVPSTVGYLRGKVFLRDVK